MAQPFPLSNQPEQPVETPSFPRRVSAKIGQPFEAVGNYFAPIVSDIAGQITHLVVPSHEAGVRQSVNDVVMGLPRQFAEAAPFMRRAPWPLKAISMADVALRSFSETSPEATAPQKLGATALNTVGFLAAPKLGAKAGGAAAKALNMGATEQKVGAFTGVIGGIEAQGAANAALAGQEYNPFTPEHVAGLAAGVLPFELMGRYQHYREQAKAKVLTEEREKSPEVQREQPTLPVTKPVMPVPIMAENAVKEPIAAPTMSLDTIRPAYRFPDGTTITADTMQGGHGEAYKKAVGVIPMSDPRWSGYEEGFKDTMTGEWLTRGQMQARGYGRTSDRMLSTTDKDILGRLETDGVEDLATPAQRMVELERLPGETVQDYLARKVGVDPRLNEPGAPDELFRTVERFSKTYFKDVLGMPDDTVNRLSDTALRIAALAGRGQERTKVVQAIPSLDEQGGSIQGFYARSRGEVPNSFIGLTVHPEPVKGVYQLLHVLGHELFHGHEVTTKDGTIQDLYKVAGEMNHQDMVDSITALTSSLADKGGKMPTDYFPLRHGAYTEDFLGRREWLADMHGLASMGAVSPVRSKAFQAVDDMLRFGNSPFTTHLRNWIRDLALVFDHLSDLGSRLKGEERTTGAKLAEVYKGLTKLQASAQEAERSVQAYLQTQDIRSARPWNPIDPVDYASVNRLMKYADVDPDMMSLIKEVSPLVIPQKGVDPVIGDKRYHWWDFWITQQQMQRIKPELADMSFLGRNYGTMAHEFSARVRSIYHDLLGRDPTQDVLKLGKDGTALNKAMSELLLRQNEWEREAHGDTPKGQKLPTTEIRKLKGFASLSKEDQALVLEHNDARGAANTFAANKCYDSFKNKLSELISLGVMSHDSSLSWQDAKAVGNAFMQLHIDQDVYRLAPNVATERWQNLAKHSEVVENYRAKGGKQAQALAYMEEVFARDENGLPENPSKATSLESRLKAYREQLSGAFRQQKGGHFDFDGRPGWSPEVRLGNWIIASKEKGQESRFEAYKDKGAFDVALAKLEKLRAEGKMEYVKHANKTDTMDDYAGMDPNRFSLYNDAMEAMTKRVIARMGQENPALSEDIRVELLDALKPGRALAAMLEAPNMKERRLIAGRENLNMVEGQQHYYNNVANTIAKRYEIADQNMYLKDPKMVANPNYVKWAKKYFKEVTSPTEHGYGFLKKAIAFNYVFFSPSLAFIELTQQGINHVPAMLMQGARMRDILSGLKKANFDVAQAYLRGQGKIANAQGVHRKLGYDDYGDPEVTRIMKLAHDKNITGAGVGWNQEFWDLAKDVSSLNARNVWGGTGTVLDRTGLIGKPLYQMYKLGINMHGIAIAQNTKVAFKTAYEHFRSKGMLEEQAFMEAEKLVTESMHGGGRAMRPLWYLGMGPGNLGATAGSVMFSLQMYVYNTVAQMGNYLTQAIKNSAKNPLEISQAHKAAATMLGAQLVLAGIGGIPISGQMIALIEQLFPGQEPKRRMREAFFGVGKWLNSKTHLVGNDEDMGQFLTTAANDGLMTTLAPWNLSNRFELGMLMGVDPFQGFDWKNLVGPGGPLLENYLTKVLPALTQGDYKDGLTAAIPNSNLRRLTQLVNDGWAVRNKDERLNVKLDSSEKTLLALGFTPKRVAEFRELDQMKQRAEKVASLEQKSFHEDMVARLKAGDQVGVTSELLRRAHETPGYDPREGARRIAELYQQQTIPYDPLRTGSRTSGTSNLGQLFDLPRGEAFGQIPEVDRYLQRIGITQKLGFPEKVSRQSLKESEVVDRLMQMNPTMSRVEALEHLQGVLRPKETARLGQYTQ